MKIQTMRGLIVLLVGIGEIICQELYSNQDILRLQPSRDGLIENINEHNSNILKSNSNGQVASNNYQFYISNDKDKNNDYSRTDRGRNKKIYRIKNPFQRSSDDSDRQQIESNDDTEIGASNQYPSVQYALPPNDFLRQMRSDHQFHQQPLMSTPLPIIGHKATPHPSYEQNTYNPNDNENTNEITQFNPNQLNQMSQFTQKISQPHSYFPSYNLNQYNIPNALGINNVPNTSQTPLYLTTSFYNNNFGESSPTSYVSSSSPFYLSSSTSLQNYVSSPYSIQSSSSDYNINKISSTIGSNALNYENSDSNRKMQIDHYNNSANGMLRFNTNLEQNQYQSDYGSSTPNPSSSLYTDYLRENWPNMANYGTNALSKSLQEVYLSPFNNGNYNGHDTRTDFSIENSNNNGHQTGNVASANNLFGNYYAQPDYQIQNRNRAKETEQDTGRSEQYSEGDYGWKLPDKRYSDSSNNKEYSLQYTKPLYDTPSENRAISQMNFHMDTGKPETHSNTYAKPASESEALEFSKEAAKAHDSMKKQQQQYYNNYAYNTDQLTNSYSSLNKYQSDPPEVKANLPDLISSSPYYQSSSRENIDNKYKQPFDHDKALKNIVPIDVSNVVQNSDTQSKLTDLGKSKNNLLQNNKDQTEQYYKALTDAFYRDKNAGYGFNIKTKPENLLSDVTKQIEPNNPFYSQIQQYENFYSPSNVFNNKRYTEGATQLESFVTHKPNNFQDNSQTLSNAKQFSQRHNSQGSSELTNLLKLNDIPYRLTQGLSSDSFRLHNSINNNYDQGSIPTSLPTRLNQDVGSHQIDTASNIISKLIASKQAAINYNKPDMDYQPGELSTINGFRVANPFNVDLKVVAEMLRGKSSIDESHSFAMRDQLSKPAPIKLDISQLQQLLSKHENSLINLGALNEGVIGGNNAYLDVYNSGRFPFQGVKYSRSQEEEESIPIAVSSNTHLIGAVIEQDDPLNTRDAGTGVDATASEDETLTSTMVDERPEKPLHSVHRTITEGLKHPNLLSNRNPYQKRFQKSKVNEPYPLLKPPPIASPRYRNSRSKIENKNYRRRIIKRKLPRYLETEALFETDRSIEEESEPNVPLLLRPPPPIAEAKSDTNLDEILSSILIIP